MKGLDITQENLTNQQGVVTNEVKVNVLNQPYGGFPWLDMPQYANTNWHNAHNFYGDLKDLEAATLGDVKTFFEKYYAPSNAAVVVVGDVDPAQTLGWIKKYFGPLPKRPVPAAARHLGAAAGEGEARDQARPARHPSRAGRVLAHAGAQHARVLRHGPRGPDPRAGQGQPPLPGAGAGEGAHRRGGGRDQPARPHVQHLRAGRARRLPVPRPGQDARPDPGRARRRGEEAPGHAGGRGHPGPRAGEDALRALRRRGRLLRLRPRRPAGLLRAVRRRPGEDQLHRGRVREGDAGAGPEGGPRVPARDQPHRAPDRPEEGREGRRCRRRRRE